MLSRWRGIACSTTPGASEWGSCCSKATSFCGSSSHSPGRSLPAATRSPRVWRGYFAGVEDDFADVELDLSWCTPFQHAVVDALRGVGRGETVTYGELAALSGHPGAARAAGSFCATNRFGIVVPCHRVVAADGLGGYGSLGLDYKRRLLALEGAA